LKHAGFLVVLLLVSGCGKPGRDTVAEAEALLLQGKAEEAARMFDVACSYAPEGEKCASSDRRAAEVRLEAAEKAMSAGQFLAAQRLLILAFSTPDGATAQKAKDRLGSDDLIQGIGYERALALGKTQQAQKAIEAVAAMKIPAAALAKAWLDKERSAIVLGTVKAACGPKPEGSCSKAAADLRAAAIAGPESEEAIALAEAEERRVYPLRVNAETFLQNFAAVAARDALIEVCMVPGNIMAGGFSEDSPGAICVNHGLTPGHCMPLPDVEEQLQKHRVNETVWRRTMTSIADPELVTALEVRKKKAREFTALDRKFDKLDIPKPKPAPKTTGGKK